MKVGGKRIILAQGKANRAKARVKFAEMVNQMAAKPAPERGRPREGDVVVR